MENHHSQDLDNIYVAIMDDKNYKFTDDDLENIAAVDNTKKFFRNDQEDIFLDINMF